VERTPRSVIPSSRTHPGQPFAGFGLPGRGSWAQTYGVAHTTIARLLSVTYQLLVVPLGSTTTSADKPNYTDFVDASGGTRFVP
jgi:hypothetical protein